MAEPKFQDRVRHKFSANLVTGTVIAKYPACDVQYISNKGPKLQLLDVRSDDDRIYYATPAENWEVTQEYKEGSDICE